MDIFLVAETWLTPDTFDNELTPPGFSVYLRDRSSRGGGVAVFVKSPSCLSSALLTHDTIEGISVLISPASVVTFVYVPPASDFHYYLSLMAFMNNLTSVYNHLVVGDFNMPDIDWNTMSAPSICSEMFCEAVVNRNLCQIISEPTHIKGNTLDLVLSDTPERISDINISDQTYSSDHYFISILFATHYHYSASPSKRNPGVDFNWNKADWTGLPDFFMDIDFSSRFTSNADITASWSLLRDSLIDACYKFVPLRKFKSKQYPSWYTPQIIHSMNKVRSLRRLIKSKRNPSSQLLDKLKILESNLPLEMAEAREAYQLQLVSSFVKTPGTLFRHLGNLVSSRTNSIPATVEYNDVYESDPVRKCNMFNSFFNSTFSDPSSPPPCFPPPVSDFHHLDISESDVYETLSSLDPHKSTGPDNISPVLLKYCAVPLTEPLHKLFVMSIHSGQPLTNGNFTS